MFADEKYIIFADGKGFNYEHNRIDTFGGGTFNGCVCGVNLQRPCNGENFV